jgi:hypothetical protein
MLALEWVPDTVDVRIAHARACTVWLFPVLSLDKSCEQMSTVSEHVLYGFSQSPPRSCAQVDALVKAFSGSTPPLFVQLVSETRSSKVNIACTVWLFQVLSLDKSCKVNIAAPRFVRGALRDVLRRLQVGTARSQPLVVRYACRAYGVSYGEGLGRLYLPRVV